MHGEPDSGGSEGVSDAEGSAPVVQLLHGDPAHLLLQAEVVLAKVVRVQGVDVGQKLKRENRDHAIFSYNFET